ncbi:MAG: DUF2029 domain-containing protein [Chloroflexi bacterium]|nr:MAG: DUF2029 domain-containing protein [Chloroflexota bacterium]
MHGPLGRHGAAGRHQRLAGHLPAEHALRALLRTAAPEDVHLDPLQVEDVDQELRSDRQGNLPNETRTGRAWHHPWRASRTRAPSAHLDRTDAGGRGAADLPRRVHARAEHARRPEPVRPLRVGLLGGRPAVPLPPGGVFVIVLARRESPRVAEVFAVTIAIAGWGTVLGRYDLVPAFVTVLALWAARRRRFGPAYALLAVGVLLKLYPALFVPLVAMEQWRALGGVPLRTRPPRAVVAGVGLFCLLTAAGFAVAFLVNPAGWLGPFSYNAGRPIQLESVPATLLWLSGLLGFPTGPDKSFGSTNLVGQLSTPISLLADLALVAGLVWVYLRQAAGRLELTAAFAGCLLVVIATGRVLSPQYLIWVLPFLAILLRRFDPVWLAVCVLTVAEFPFGYLALHPGPPGHLAPYPGFLFVLIALRNAALVVAIVRFLIASSARAAAAAA